MAKAPVLTPRADDFPRWYQDVLQQGGAGRERAGPRHHGDPPLRLLRSGSGCRPRSTSASRRRRRERLLPAVHPRVVPQPRGRARRGLQPRARGRHPRRRQGARGADRRAAHERDGHRRVHGEVDPELPRPAAAAEPVGQRRALGAAAAPVPAHHASSSGRRATPRTRPTTTRTRTPCASCTTSTRTSWSNVLAMPVVVGHEDRAASASPARSTRSRAKG